MKSTVTESFIKRYRKLPEKARLDARDAYRIFKRDPFANSLRFKKVFEDNQRSIWSARTSLGWRAVGVRVANDQIIWFWIGSHAEYDELFRHFKKMTVPG